MMRIKEKSENEFQPNENDNKSNKKDVNRIPEIDNKIAEKSSSYTLENTKDLQTKIESITQYLKPYIPKMLYEVLQVNHENVKIICDYIIAEQNELNIKESTKETKIKKLVHLSRYFHHKKTFIHMTKGTY
jgi:hypothetical protein